MIQNNTSANSIIKSKADNITKLSKDAHLLTELKDPLRMRYLIYSETYENSNLLGHNTILKKRIESGSAYRIYD